MKARKTALWLMRLNRGQSRRIILLACSQVLVALLGVAFAVITSFVVDGALQGLTPGFRKAAAVLAAAGAAQIGLNFLCRHLQADITAGIDIHMKHVLFADILRKEYAAIGTYHSGALRSRLDDDIRVISEGLTEILPGMIGMAVRLLAAFGAVCFVDLRFALAFLLAGVLSMVFASVLRKKMQELHREERETTEKVSGFMQEAAGNLLLVKTFGAEQIILRRAEQLQQKRKLAIRRRKCCSAAMGLFMNIAFYGGYIAGLIWCAVKIALGTITVGTFSAVIQLTGQIERPLTAISGYIPRIAAVLASAERVRAIMELPEEEIGAEADLDRCGDISAIRVENVTFSYDRELILSGADLTLAKGEFAVLEGTSGMGKSTLMKLLLGVYAPTEGRIYLETGMGQLPIDSQTRKLFSYVPQGNFILSGTLRENICLMCPDAEKEKIYKALQISDCLPFVQALPQGLDTPVGERGAGLSEGQLQRLAIARALLADAPVLLLDECTSALDEETERRVLSNLRTMTDKTCLLISHKKAARDVCDRVYTIEQGKIKEVRQ